MDTERFKFNQHRDCEFFPCHETNDPDSFNCLFCYCPLYMLKEDCGGNFSYDNPYGIKDCSGCMVPHSKGGYDHVMAKMDLVIKKKKKQNG